MVALGADYLLHQDDIPNLQILLTYGHSPRTTLHSTSIATASAKLPAESLSESPLNPSLSTVRTCATIPGSSDAPADR